MSIKSKKWYENQILALENAAKNTGKLIQELPFNSKSEDYENVQKYNSPIQKECSKIYEKLNKLKDEYWLYYK